MAWTGWRPSEEDAAKGLAFDPVVEALVPDPSEVGPFFVLQGWLGPGVADGVYRVYRHHDLSEYHEIAREDIRYAAPAGEATRVWVRRGAPMRHVVLRAEPAEVDYLSGPIAEHEAHRLVIEQGDLAAKPTRCPPCPSRSP